MKVRYFRIENGSIPFFHQLTPPATLVLYFRAGQKQHPPQAAFSHFMSQKFYTVSLVVLFSYFWYFTFSCGPGLSEKVSRRAILDRSLNYESLNCNHDEDDIWYNSKQLFQDHIKEINGKWDSIEDDIWGKIIVMERNRRVAKGNDAMGDSSLWLPKVLSA